MGDFGKIALKKQLTIRKQNVRCSLKFNTLHTLFE